MRKELEEKEKAKKELEEALESRKKKPLTSTPAEGDGPNK